MTLLASSAPGQPEQPGRGRFVFVDALRGLAAVGVMAYHFTTGDLARPLAAALTPRVTAILDRGWLGVHVFFTLSGFVIAHSVGRVAMTGSRAARFVLRRQVRLDPPYWFTIALGTALPYGWHLAQPNVPHVVPTPGVVLAHVLYVYDLLGVRPIYDVFWSLAIEVQFYFAFVLVLALAHVFGHRAPRALPWLLAASAAQSLGWAIFWRFPHAWFTQHWYLFALGALARWALDGRARPGLVAVLALGCLGAGAWAQRLEPAAGGVVALALLAAGRRGALGRWLGARPLQFLGAVSYGVYLLHTVVGAHVRFVLDPWVRADTPRGAVVTVAAMIAASLLAAWGLRATVETWALRLAARIRWADAAVSSRERSSPWRRRARAGGTS